MQIMGNAIVVATNLGIKGFNMMGKAIQWAKDNADVIIPVLGVIVGSLTAYNAVMAISTGLSAAHAAIMAVVTGAKTAYSLAVAFATGNQMAFNAALQACPIVWIIDAIIAAIAVVVALIMVFHNLADTGHTVFGDIAGVAIGCLNAIQNGLAMLANVFIGAAEFIANAWNTGIYNIQMAFFNRAGVRLSRLTPATSFNMSSANYLRIRPPSAIMNFDLVRSAVPMVFAPPKSGSETCSTGTFVATPFSSSFLIPSSKATSLA
jgi:hypothetical protein